MGAKPDFKDNKNPQNRSENRVKTAPGRSNVSPAFAARNISLRAMIQRVQALPQGVTRSLNPGNVLQLQPAIGNRAVGQLLRSVGYIKSGLNGAAVIQRESKPGEEAAQKKSIQGSDIVQQTKNPDEEAVQKMPVRGHGIFQRSDLPFARPAISAQKKENRSGIPGASTSASVNQTGMPDNLKSGVESLSGLSMDHVRVHYNSPGPAQIYAHAYTQGADIHVAPAQERHLPHEAWHVVQQARGRVRPTLQMYGQKKGGLAINDDAGLEREADVMGQKAQQMTLQKKLHTTFDKFAASDLANLTGKQPGRLVQRKIFFGGLEQTLANLLKDFNDESEKLIVTNWANSATLHDFADKGKLKTAVTNAAAHSEEIPALYKKANLKFLTKADNRLPTLYFESGSDSGRIRQQHGEGPAVKSQSDKVDYFFQDQNKMRAFCTAAGLAKQNNQDFNLNLDDYNGVTAPTADYYHAEVTYSGKKVLKVHPSGGKISVTLDAYDDNSIKAIYKQVIGRA